VELGEGVLMKGVVMNFNEYKREKRIENIIDRLDRRGKELMDRAIDPRRVADYRDCLVGFKIVRDRIIKLALYIDSLSSGSQRRTA
jgi:hypothetical protein